MFLFVKKKLAEFINFISYHLGFFLHSLLKPHILCI